MMIGWVEPEALIRILWAAFCDARRLMDMTCAKVDLLDPKGMHPKIRSADRLIRSMKSGIMPSRDDASCNFRKEHLHQLRTAHRDESSTQQSVGGDLKRQSDTQFHGDTKG